MSKKDYFSINSEPALNASLPEREESICVEEIVQNDKPASFWEKQRDSVFSEPAISSENSGDTVRSAILKKAAHISFAKSWGVSFLAGLIGGILSVPGVFLANSGGMFAFGYIIIGGPVAEELMKQCGMIYLTEYKPWYIKNRWQYYFAAIISALIFATIENILYINVYLAKLPLDKLERVASFRWSICTLLHVSCALIASLGLKRVWDGRLLTGKPADLAYAYPYFILAIVIHGLYNFTMTILGDKVF
ncbi:MAG: PrsW family intramembrane metalloprotease [Lentisphaerae bacterium]|nr:PrsW family intramembrane metalloprotease [Lentisphaerota bacterium]MCP4103254.1 PrsW family intramembrane metalloprotease [Lentisphaerota bacterium]